MIKLIRLLVLLIGVSPLLSLAPAPEAHTVYWTRIAVQTSAPLVQACSYELAPATARQSAVIFDSIGYPYGLVTAFSCDGNSIAVARELIERADQMQAEAAAYRQAHPIGGAP